MEELSNFDQRLIDAKSKDSVESIKQFKENQIKLYKNLDHQDLDIIAIFSKWVELLSNALPIDSDNVMGIIALNECAKESVIVDPFNVLYDTLDKASFVKELHETNLAKNIYMTKSCIEASEHILPYEEYCDGMTNVSESIVQRMYISTIIFELFQVLEEIVEIFENLVNDQKQRISYMEWSDLFEQKLKNNCKAIRLRVELEKEIRSSLLQTKSLPDFMLNSQCPRPEDISLEMIHEYLRLLKQHNTMLISPIGNKSERSLSEQVQRIESENPYKLLQHRRARYGDEGNTLLERYNFVNLSKKAARKDATRRIDNELKYIINAIKNKNNEILDDLPHLKSSITEGPIVETDQHIDLNTPELRVNLINTLLSGGEKAMKAVDAQDTKALGELIHMFDILDVVFPRPYPRKFMDDSPVFDFIPNDIKEYLRNLVHRERIHWPKCLDQIADRLLWYKTYEAPDSLLKFSPVKDKTVQNIVEPYL